MSEEAAARAAHADTCPGCRYDLEYDDCWDCGGDGAVSGFPDTPFEQCGTCDGEGTVGYCPNRCGGKDEAISE